MTYVLLATLLVVACSVLFFLVVWLGYRIWVLTGKPREWLAYVLANTLSPGILLSLLLYATIFSLLVTHHAPSLADLTTPAILAVVLVAMAVSKWFLYKMIQKALT